MRVRVIDAEQVFPLFAHPAHCIDLATGIHGKQLLRLVRYIGYRYTTLWLTLFGCNQATDFRIGGRLGLVQNPVNKLTWQDDAFHGLQVIQ